MSGNASVWEPSLQTDISGNTKSVEETIVAATNQEVFELETFTYALGTGALELHKNGLLLAKGVEWAELTESTFRLLPPFANSLDKVVATGKVGIEGVVEVGQVVAVQPGYAVSIDNTDTQRPIVSADVGAKEAVALALNVPVADVGDEASGSDVASYLLAESQQVTYIVPADAVGKIISGLGVVGNVLNTTIGGPYQLVPSSISVFSSVDELKNSVIGLNVGQLVTTGGTTWKINGTMGLSNPLSYIDVGNGLGAFQVSELFVSDWGAVLDGQTDDHIPVQACLDFVRQVGGQAVKLVNFSGRNAAVSDMLSVQGPTDPNQANIRLHNGGVTALPGFSDDSPTNPKPVIEFSTQARSCGMHDFVVDCNRNASGVVIRVNEGASHCVMHDFRIIRFMNPFKPKQANLYTNLNAASHSEIPLRRYWSTQEQPYGIRIGNLTTSNDNVVSSQAIIHDGVIRQWPEGDPEVPLWSDYTGLGIWAQCDDAKIHHVQIAKCLKPYYLAGVQNEVSMCHLTPTAPSNYSGADPITPDTIVISGEIDEAWNRIIGNYNEHAIAVSNMNFLCLGNIFPKNSSDTSGNTAGIYLVATEAGQVISSSKDLDIDNNIQAVGALPQLVDYYEADGFTFADKIDFARFAEAPTVRAQKQEIVRMSTGNEVARFGTVSNSCIQTFINAASTVDVQFGSQVDRVVALINGVNVMDVDETQRVVKSLPATTFTRTQTILPGATYLTSTSSLPALIGDIVVGSVDQDIGEGQVTWSVVVDGTIQVAIHNHGATDIVLTAAVFKHRVIK